MNPDIQNPVISGWVHQSSYYLLLCWHPESITRLLLLKEPTINGAPIMNSIIKERTMFWSCRVDNRRAAISHLPLHSPNNGSITASVICNKRMDWWKIICRAHMHKNADKTTSKHPRLVFPVWINERARPLLITFHVWCSMEQNSHKDRDREVFKWLFMHKFLYLSTPIPLWTSVDAGVKSTFKKTPKRPKKKEKKNSPLCPHRTLLGRCSKIP